MLLKTFNEFSRNTIFFPKIPVFEFFDISWTIITFETISRWKQPNSAIKKNSNTPSLKSICVSTKNRISDRFENSSAIIRFETHCAKISANLPFLKIFNDYLEKETYQFFQKTSIFECFEEYQAKRPLETFFKNNSSRVAALKTI